MHFAPYGAFCPGVLHQFALEDRICTQLSPTTQHHYRPDHWSFSPHLNLRLNASNLPNSNRTALARQLLCDGRMLSSRCLPSLLSLLLLNACVSDEESYSGDQDRADNKGLTWTTDAELSDLSEMEAMTGMSLEALRADCATATPRTEAKKIYCYFENNAKRGSFSGVGDKNIAYAIFPAQRPDARALVLVSGRTESMLKYAEFIYDLKVRNADLGFSIYILDNRGQGFSDRLLPLEDKEGIELYKTEDYQKGYIDEFADYVSDLDTFVTEVVRPAQFSESYILGHSMGGAIVTGYLQNKPSAANFDSAVLSSPMHGIEALQGAGGAFNISILLPYPGDSYAPYNENYVYYPHKDLIEGETLDLTTSAPRYELTQWAYRSTPYAQISLGGATAHWLLYSEAAVEIMVEEANKIKTPILLLQAGKEKLVSRDQQNAFCNAIPDLCTIVPYPESEHEVMQEVDGVRNDVMNRIVGFFGGVKQ